MNGKALFGDSRDDGRGKTLPACGGYQDSSGGATRPIGRTRLRFHAPDRESASSRVTAYRASSTRLETPSLS